MTEEAKEKKNFELEKQIQALQKENKKLRTWTDELIKSQEKVLQDAIQGAKDVIATNEETIPFMFCTLMTTRPCWRFRSRF